MIVVGWYEIILWIIPDYDRRHMKGLDGLFYTVFGGLLSAVLSVLIVVFVVLAIIKLPKKKHSKLEGIIESIRFSRLSLAFYYFHFFLI